MKQFTYDTLFLCNFFTVSTLANPLFPFLGGYRNPSNMDQDDGVIQGQAGAQQQGGFDDDNEMPGLAPQAGTTMAPDADSSSSSSSEEDTAAAGGGAATTAPPAGPIVGNNPAVNPQAGPDAGAGQAGDSSNDNVNIQAVDAGPIMANPDPGNTSGDQTAGAGANPLNFQPQAIKQQQSAQSSAAIAATTLILVAGVAATAAVAYKYKDAISARMGF